MNQERVVAVLENVLSGRNMNAWLMLVCEEANTDAPDWRYAGGKAEVFLVGNDELVTMVAAAIERSRDYLDGRIVELRRSELVEA